ncbi:peptidylprolyl isomerase [Paenibacillus sp. KS-LC4]|uniref:peptidylprolyl isomerase n=1 Tax=Paenibacillus sp. KS-LC4 TaxID=2979727 RepID=UPI0030D15691
MLHNTRKSTWRRMALLVVAAVLVMSVLAACGSKKEEGNGTAFSGTSEGATVATYKDNGKVTEAEFTKYLAVFNFLQPGYESVTALPQFQEQLLQQYIAYKILAAQASEETVKQAAKDTDKQFADFEAALAQQAELKTQLEAKNITNSDVKTYMKLMLVVVDHMKSKVTDEELKKEFETNIAKYSTVTLRHILIATSEKDSETQETKELRTKEEALKIAKEVKAKLDEGGDWAALAKVYSDDPGSKESGGQYANAKPGDWVENFKNAAMTQKIGVIGDPVETEYGYHVIMVEKRDELTYDKLDDATKEAVESAVAYAHMSTFMSEDMKNQDVKITLPEQSPAPDAEQSPAASDAAKATDDAAASQEPAASASPSASVEPSASPAAK